MEKSQTYLQRFGKLLFQWVFMAAKKTFLSSCQLGWCVQLTFLLHILLYKDNVQWLVWYWAAFRALEFSWCLCWMILNKQSGNNILDLPCEILWDSQMKNAREERGVNPKPDFSWMLLMMLKCQEDQHVPSPSAGGFPVLKLWVGCDFISLNEDCSCFIYTHNAWMETAGNSYNSGVSICMTYPELLLQWARRILEDDSSGPF